MKIREKIRTASVYKTFSNYKISMVILIIWTVMEVCFNVEMYFFPLPFLFSLFAEMCLKKGKKYIHFFYLLAAVFSLVLYYFAVAEGNMIHFGRERAQGIWTGCVILLIIFMIYFSFRKSEHSFPEYLRRIVFTLLPMVLFGFILMTGFVVMATLLEEFFTVNFNGLQVLLRNFYAVPCCIYAVSNAGKKEDSASSCSREVDLLSGFVVKYLFNIFSICVMVICYLAVCRMIVFGAALPHMICEASALLFLAGVPVWIINDVYTDETIRSRAVSVLPCIFAPLIVLHIGTAAGEIREYGIEPEGYIWVMLIIFEISVMLIWKFSREHCERVLLVLAVLVIISVAVPVINMYSLSDRNQEYFLNKYLQKAESGEELSELEYGRLESAYRYKRNRISREELEEKYGIVKEFLTENADTYQEKWHEIYGRQLAGEIDIDGFKKMSMLKQSDSYDLNQPKAGEIDFSRFIFVKMQTGEEVEIDLKEFYEKCLEFERQNPGSDMKEASDYMKQHNKIEINDSQVFYVDQFDIIYYSRTEDGERKIEVAGMNISGMLLEK